MDAGARLPVGTGRIGAGRVGGVAHHPTFDRVALHTRSLGRVCRRATHAFFARDRRRALSRWRGGVRVPVRGRKFPRVAGRRERIPKRLRPCGRMRLGLAGADLPEGVGLPSATRTTATHASRLDRAIQSGCRRHSCAVGRVGADVKARRNPGGGPDPAGVQDRGRVLRVDIRGIEPRSSHQCRSRKESEAKRLTEELGFPWETAAAIPNQQRPRGAGTFPWWRVAAATILLGGFLFFVDSKVEMPGSRSLAPTGGMLVLSAFALWIISAAASVGGIVAAIRAAWRRRRAG